MKVVETFTEEQLWYVCAIAKAFDNLQSNWNSLREWLLKDTKDTFFEVVRIKDVLDKMNELEGVDNEIQNK